MKGKSSLLRGIQVIVVYWYVVRTQGDFEGVGA